MANEFNLPQDIIHHIQSFLNARDQAQSSVLSKSWYISRPTRPVLTFDENEYSPKDPSGDVFSHEFSKFSTESLSSYATQNLKLDKFTLRMKIGQEHKPCTIVIGNNEYITPAWGMTEYDFSLRNELAGELITSALELGASEIELKLNYHANFNVRYDLPVQVFAYSSLTRLSVDRYVIDGVVADRVLCSRLKYLVLDKVKTTDDVVRDIFARCPLIANLDFNQCVGLDKLNVSNLIKLVGLRIDEGLMVSVEFINLDRMNVTEFRCLRQLKLEKVRIGAEFFTEFRSLFPCVEDLTLGYCGDYDEINISSHLIRRLSLHQGEKLKKVQLNVPNISKFVFEAGMDDIDTRGNHFKPLPSLSFDNVSKDWESDVLLSRSCEVIDACWFEDLRKFLIQLTLSRISLDVDFDVKSVIPGEEIPCFPPLVEKLKVCTCFSWGMSDSLLLGLSRSCRSNLITECNECQI